MTKLPLQSSITKLTTTLKSRSVPIMITYALTMYNDTSIAANRLKYSNDCTVLLKMPEKVP